LILQGVSTSEAIAELVDQLGYAIREYHRTKGVPRRHPIPHWAWSLAATVTTLMITAFLLEWLIVKRKVTRKRLFVPMGRAVDGIKSKTHMIF